MVETDSPKSKWHRAVDGGGVDEGAVTREKKEDGKRHRLQKYTLYNILIDLDLSIWSNVKCIQRSKSNRKGRKSMKFDSSSPIQNNIE